VPSSLLTHTVEVSAFRIGNTNGLFLSRVYPIPEYPIALTVVKTGL
jgi:hypothetical protein